MNDSIDVIVLSLADYKESDSIVTVLSKEYGKMSFYARGTRKMTSKNRSSLQPYMESTFLYDHKENGGMQRLKSSACIKPFRHMRQTLEGSLAAALISEATQSLSMENEPVEGVYEALLEAYAYLEKGCSAVSVSCVYLAQLLDLCGFGINVDSCAVCGEAKAAAVSVKEGGFVCPECARRLNLKSWDISRLHRFRMIVHSGMDNFELFEQYEKAGREDLEIIAGFVRLHTGIPLKSYELFSRI